MSTQKACLSASSKDRFSALKHLNFGASNVRKQHITRQHRPEILDGIDDSAYISGQNNDIAAHASARRVFNSRVNGHHFLRFSEHTGLIGADNADSAMP